jgi:hypothetical protein
MIRRKAIVKKGRRGEKTKTFFGVGREYRVIVKLIQGAAPSHLCGTLELAPALLEATASHVAGPISHRASAAGSVGAGGRVLAAEAAI